jgi:hypothetical protein
MNRCEGHRGGPVSGEPHQRPGPLLSRVELLGSSSSVDRRAARRKCTGLTGGMARRVAQVHPESGRARAVRSEVHGSCCERLSELHDTWTVAAVPGRNWTGLGGFLAAPVPKFRAVAAGRRYVADTWKVAGQLGAPGQQVHGTRERRDGATVRRSRGAVARWPAELTGGTAAAESAM